MEPIEILVNTQPKPLTKIPVTYEDGTKGLKTPDEIWYEKDGKVIDKPDTSKVGTFNIHYLINYFGISVDGNSAYGGTKQYDQKVNIVTKLTEKPIKNDKVTKPTKPTKEVNKPVNTGAANKTVAKKASKKVLPNTGAKDSSMAVVGVIALAGAVVLLKKKMVK